MIKNKFIVVPFMLPWDWSADYQKQTCLLLSRKNQVVAYMQKDALFFLKLPFRNRKIYPRIKNVKFYTPTYVLPFRRFSQIEKLNQAVSFKIFSWLNRSQKAKVLWLFDPDFHFYPKFASNFLSLYDCVDYHWAPNKAREAEIRASENKLIKAVDLFVVNSNILYDVHAKVRKADRVVPQGFRLGQYAKHKIHKKNRIKKFLIGYIGAVNYRIDYNLLTQLARRNPKWNFIISGPILEKERIGKTLSKKMKTFFNLSNVRYELRDKKLVPEIISRFDIACIPYDSTQDFNRYCYPMKLFEYFYLGKPVVSTPIEELKRFPKFVKIGKSANEWEEYIKELLSKPWPKVYKDNQRKLAEKNSWENKIRNISKLINNYFRQ